MNDIFDEKQILDHVRSVATQEFGPTNFNTDNHNRTKIGRLNYRPSIYTDTNKRDIKINIRYGSDVDRNNSVTKLKAAGFKCKPCDAPKAWPYVLSLWLDKVPTSNVQNVAFREAINKSQ